MKEELKGTFAWSVKKIGEGLKVRRPHWDESVYHYVSDDHGKVILEEDGTIAQFSFDDFTATDWEICSEYPKKIDMGCGYYISLEKNGWMNYNSSLQGLTLCNKKEDLDILESAIKEARALIK